MRNAGISLLSVPNSRRMANRREGPRHARHGSSLLREAIRTFHHQRGWQRVPSDYIRRLIGKLDERIAGGQFRGLVLAGFASREFLTSRLISRQVKSSVYVGEKVSDFTQPMRSAAGNVDQSLFRCSRVRCSLARQDFSLSLGVWSNPPIEPAARQLAVRSQLGTPSATAAPVRCAEA